MKTNCFAETDAYKSGCAVLIEKLCNKRKCPFYKTEEQYYADLIKYPVKNKKYLT